MNKDIDASEARVRALFERLNAYVEAVPAFIRDRVDWNMILPLKGKFGAPFETLLENMDDIMEPDGDFMALHAAYFLNQDYPDRLFRYLENLQRAGRYTDGQGGEVLHRLLATLDQEGLEAIDAEVLETVERVFENRNMESMEEAFEAINGALPFVHR